MLAILLAAVQLGAAPAQAQEPPETIYDDLVCSYDWPCREALAIMWCESKGSPSAYSQGNYGLFEINQVHRDRVGGDPSRFYDPETNVRVAHDLWTGAWNHPLGRWGPWRGCMWALPR